MPPVIPDWVTSLPAFDNREPAPIVVPKIKLVVLPLGLEVDAPAIDVLPRCNCI